MPPHSFQPMFLVNQISSNPMEFNENLIYFLINSKLYPKFYGSAGVSLERKLGKTFQGQSDLVGRGVINPVLTLNQAISAIAAKGPQWHGKDDIIISKQIQSYSIIHLQRVPPCEFWLHICVMDVGGHCQQSSGLFKKIEEICAATNTTTLCVW